MENEPLISIEQVTRRFKHRDAIRNVSLTIKQGELFGILGPDGTGKTTLLRMMAGVLNPTAGSITVGEYDSVKQAEDVKHIMGYMPQQFGLYGDLTVAENLNFAADVYGVVGAEREKRLAELYEFTQLNDFKKRKAGLLSGGMKKKLALAGALIHRPEILLLDEPTTGVDPVARRNFWDLLSGLHGQGTTTVVSTPYMDEAERCNRVALLFEGEILAWGTPQEIKAQIPGHVLTMKCADMRRANRVLQNIEGLLDLQTYGDQLNIITELDFAEAEKVVRANLETADIAVESLTRGQIRMEEAFIYLVNQAQKGRAA